MSRRATSKDAGGDRPARRGSRFTNALIAVFLIVQIVLPLRYYLGLSHPYDERFAWRMYSPVRMVECSLRFRVPGERGPIRLDDRFHQAWITLARRGRRSVIDAMARRLCEQHQGSQITLHMICRSLDNLPVTVSDGSTNLCSGDVP